MNNVVKVLTLSCWMALLGCASTAPNLTRLANEAAVLHQARTDLSDEISCDSTKTVRLSDYEYQVSCDNTTLLVRCTRRHSHSCCRALDMNQEDRIEHDDANLAESVCSQ